MPHERRFYFAVLVREKYIVVVPSKQIRRSPAVPSRTIQLAASASYPQRSIPPLNHYGPIKAGATLPTSNQKSHGFNDIAPSHNGANYASLTYGKSPVIYPYPYSAKLYPPYSKYKGGFVPLNNQNRYPERYPAEANRPRPQAVPIYAGTGPPNFYPLRPISNDPYIVNKNLPAKLQPIERPQSIFTEHQQRPFIGNPLDPVKNAQSDVSPFLSKVSPIVVKAPPNNQQEATHTGDLVKDGSNAIGKVPSASTIGATTGQFVIRDTIMLDDYEKKISEFTKSWPKLSAFPGAYSSSSSLYPASSFEPMSSSGVAEVSRSSDILGTINTTSRKGYEVKEDIDEPPFDYRSIAASPLQQYPSIATTALTKNLYVSN
ncbi:uncharacterized protein LOC131666037 [Phymastichus coffea]|uniref:uncharacterized protein LOC131666037 n=1 Tax=Phymastichus coffea TaxID=108790 RepID=UPI00273B0336|nr:uncharacterized protein LOC131666037 [Phymastichus coffea]